MRNLVAVPLLLLLVILQSSVVSRLRLSSGAADLLLVWLAAWALHEQVRTAPHWAALAAGLTGFVTGLPVLAVVAGFGSVVLVAKLLSRRVWQAPLLAMFAVTFLGTFAMHAVSYAALLLSGTPLPLGPSITLVTLPSVILNLLLAIPVFYWSRDLAHWVYPESEAA